MRIIPKRKGLPRREVESASIRPSMLSSSSDEHIEDTAGAMFSGNTETFITATYQDSDGTVDLVVPVKDEDNMSSDSDTHLSTQQSIKAYNDNSITTHASVTTSVHNFDASGNAPPQDHASNHTDGTDDVADLVGDSGAGGTHGLAPAPGAGDAAANKYLKSDGTWQAVVEAGGAAIATDPIWDAKGDIVVATGDNAATRLAIGTDNYVLRVATDTPAWEAVGIADNNMVEVDGSPSANNMTYWTANGIAGYAMTGTTFPSSPFDGMTFCHEVTGRKILYTYDADNTTWVPIISIGAMTLYVDATDGSDSLEDHGTGVDGDAFATVQYAIDTIPGQYGGNVTININAETYAEDLVIRGKQATGNYTITLQGTLTAGDSLTADGNGDIGAGATLPSFYENGMVADEYQHMLLKFTSGSNDGLYRVIDTNSNDAGTHKITLCGPVLAAQPTNGDTATIYDWGTTISSIQSTNGQQGVIVYDVYCNSTSSVNFNCGLYSTLTCYRCKASNASTQHFFSVDNGFIKAYNCLASGSYNYPLWLASKGSIYFYGGKIVNFGDRGVYGEDFAYLGLMRGGVVDGGNYGVFLTTNSAGKFWSDAVNNQIRNANVSGLYANQGTQMYQTATNTYSGCTSDETAVAASFGYID